MSYKSIGKSIRDKANFTYSSLKEAAKESAEKHGIPIKGSYWKEHPIDAALTVASFVTGGVIGASDAYVLSGEDFGKLVYEHKLDEDATLFPPHRHEQPPSSARSDLNVRITRPMNAGDYASLFAPFLLIGVPMIIEGVRYYRWKNSIKKIAKSI